MEYNAGIMYIPLTDFKRFFFAYTYVCIILLTACAFDLLKYDFTGILYKKRHAWIIIDVLNCCAS